MRALSDPRAGWSLADAVDLAEQGYQLEQVQRVSGWHPAEVRAAQVRAARARVAGPERAGPAERG